ncbi:LytTR family DNA-binding domain-containing protein [Halalkalibacterium halodurans]|uniref:LytTR family DNA-binding domain-containing protein n=1 Tax=Halalkalibacterium halodurans TaxID=86665 RepID=UPI002AAA561C|nr:LytTR family DNA-binding domain-containing protein [Halalkalibacterium halodurans]MDY7222099.1 LytTR family DNA-binding domain-containing protein [Halalkalibacterium halodurans]MDY7243882.1 LytTR family DNA-binding domain-containing protein [Halalkalibacterium halodurans]
MKIPVVGKDGNVTLIDHEDILYIVTKIEKVYIHTDDEVYTPVRTLKEFESLLAPHGFERLDKSNVTNVSAIKSYDRLRKTAYFDKDQKGKGTHVSRRNIEKIKNRGLY